MLNETIYLEIVPERRIVFAYTMALGQTPFSASLATVELTPASSGTTLTFTEQDAFLDGRDALADREEGTVGLLERLDLVLRES
jgi:uncharacterized protein YndB with AHSA1/START domain